MAIYYVDYLNGNDANNGTSFATRKQTLSSVFAVAPLAAGDEVRIMKSSDPVSIGNCTWVSNTSGSIILPDNTTKLLYSDGTWIGGPGVTTTTTTTRKQGANAVQLTMSNAFSSGKIAYFPLSALNAGRVDVSSFSKLSFWFYTNVLNNNGSLSGINVRLCSDTFGETALYTLNFPASSTLGNAVWTPFTLDNGSLFTAATAVSSIAFWSSTDVNTTAGNIAWIIDNVFATNNIALDTLVSKNSTNAINWDANEHWYPIRSIENNVVSFDMGLNVSLAGAATKGFYTFPGLTPVTATNVPTYILSAVPLRTTRPQDYTITYAYGGIIPSSRTGTLFNRISVSGGWNETDMSTQTGFTWMAPQYGQGTFIYLHNTPTGWSFSNLGFFKFAIPFYMSSFFNMSAVEIKNCAFVGNQYGYNVNASNSGTANLTLDKLSVVGCGVNDNRNTAGPIFQNNSNGYAPRGYRISNVYVSNSVGAMYIGGTTGDCMYTNLTAVNGNSGVWVFRFGASLGVVGKNIHVDNATSTGLYIDVGRNHYYENIYIARIFTDNQTGTGIFIGYVDNNSGSAPINHTLKNVYVGYCGTSFFDNVNYVGGIIMNPYADNMKFYNTFVEYCSSRVGTNGSYISGPIVPSANTFFYNLTSRNNYLAGASTALRYSNSVQNQYSGVVTYIHNYDFNETSPYFVSTYGGSNGSNNKFITINAAQSGNSTVITTTDGQIRTVTSPTYNGGTAWLMDVQGTARNQYDPLTQELGNVYAQANQTYTASVYVYRTGGAIAGSFIMDNPQWNSSQIVTLSANTTNASLSAWEKLSLTFTPTQNCFVGFTMAAYISAVDVTNLTHDLIWDNFEITPATTTVLSGGEYSTVFSRGAVYLTSSETTITSGGGSGGGESAFTFC